MLFLGEQPVAGLLVSQVIVSAFQGAVQTKTIRYKVLNRGGVFLNFGQNQSSCFPPASSLKRN